MRTRFHLLRHLQSACGDIKAVVVNYVKVARVFCSGKIKEKNVWYLIIFGGKFKIHFWALGRRHDQLKFEGHNSDQIRIEERGIVILHKL